MMPAKVEEVVVASIRQPVSASMLATVRRETGSWRWVAAMFAYMLALAYATAFVTYHAAVGLGWG